MKDYQRKKIRLAGRVLMIIYIFLLIYFLFLAEWYGREPGGYTEPRYNLIPFLEIKRFWRHRSALGAKIVFLNLFGNVIGFIPLGFLLPIVSPVLKKPGIVICLGVCISMTVEYLQLILRVGSCDIDDVILNTFGTVIGYLSYRICNAVRRRFYGKKTKV